MSSAPNVAPTAQPVCAVADVKHLTIPASDYLLVACDGLFEELTNAQVVQLVRREVARHPHDPARVCSRLLMHSLRAGSKDNMTAVFVQFMDGSEYARPDEFVAGPYYRRCQNAPFAQAYEKDAGRQGMTGLPLWEVTSSCREVVPPMFG